MNRIALLAAIAIPVLIAGCVSLGGNVKGNFVCRAPDGMCAPTSKIDDQALAVMDGDGAAQAGSPDAPQNVSSASATAHSPHALKVVLPVRADRFGRWRAQSVVYVEPETMAGKGADAPAGANSGRPVGPAPARLSYAELAAGAPGLTAFDQALTVNGASAATVSPSASIRQQVEQTLGKSTAGAGATAPSTPARPVSTEPGPVASGPVHAPSFPATTTMIAGEH